MRKEKSILNDNPFRINETFDNGLQFNDVFPARSGLFREDGTLLSFKIQYNDGVVAHIVLVPENEWLENGMDFIEDWLAPIGLAVVAGRLVQKGKGAYRDISSLAEFSIGVFGMEGIKFLTGGIRNSNLIYVNINTGTKYLSYPLQYDSSIFNG